MRTPRDPARTVGSFRISEAVGRRGMGLRRRLYCDVAPKSDNTHTRPSCRLPDTRKPGPEGQSRGRHVQFRCPPGRRGPFQRVLAIFSSATVLNTWRIQQYQAGTISQVIRDLLAGYPPGYSPNCRRTTDGLGGPLRGR